MENCKLYLDGNCRGEVTFTDQGSCTEVRAAIEDPGDGLYRAFLQGPGGELRLGVLEPCGSGTLALCRRLYTRDIRCLGMPMSGEVRRSFPMGAASPWRETVCPRDLFRSDFLRSRLERQGRAWWRREGERLYLAIPLERGWPFPLEALFCLAQIRQVEGRVCAVFAFRGEEPELF